MVYNRNAMEYYSEAIERDGESKELLVSYDKSKNAVLDA